MIVNLVRICQGFLNVGPALPGGPEQYFNNVAEPTFVIKSCLYNVQTLILDAVVVRQFIVPSARSCTDVTIRYIERISCGNVTFGWLSFRCWDGWAC